APTPMADEFIDHYCAGCHGDESPEAKLDLTSLKYDPEDRANFSQWVKVFDRVKAGEMPPKKKKRPEAADLEKFLRGMTETLTAAEKAIVARDGRAMERRLNRYEYENAVRDLLNVPWAQIKDKLPLDGERYGFNKSGEALDMSFVQMDRYLV